MRDVRLIRELQEKAARAIPAAVQEHRDGCWLRLTDSPTTWWAGAALLHGSTPHDLPTRIAGVEDFYAVRDAPARFQVCPACPVELDDALARRGYQLGDVVSLQVATARDIRGLVPDATPVVHVAEQPDLTWCRLLVAAQDPQGDVAAEWRLVQRVDGPAAYVTVDLGGQPVAVGRAVLDVGWTGVFGMATLASARRRGAAGAVLRALAEWSTRHGSDRLYLQVLRDSAGAGGLYRRAGFQELCTYHYRTSSAARG